MGCVKFYFTCLKIIDQLIDYQYCWGFIQNLLKKQKKISLYALIVSFFLCGTQNSSLAGTSAKYTNSPLQLIAQLTVLSYHVGKDPNECPIPLLLLPAILQTTSSPNPLIYYLYPYCVWTYSLSFLLSLMCTFCSCFFFMLFHISAWKIREVSSPCFRHSTKICGKVERPQTRPITPNLIIACK